ncbi:MAG: peptide ABC transporter ATP-binding protein [Deltaproteobacteria bacterium]|nr:MAG: peptide ABC transporter ATP-binding protein [Deltaproteobacteria bacterium]
MEWLYFKGETQVSDPLLSIEGLTLSFKTRKGFVRVLENLEFSLEKGEILGIVGESGCGKTLTAQTIMGLVKTPPAHIDAGKILFHEQDLLALTERQMTDIRGRRIAMIFQEPMTSFNPVKTIGWQIAEMFRRHKGMGRKKSLFMAETMLEKVQIPEPGKRLHSFAHEMSGGMCQRAMIGMALSCNPEILIADEPTTALDVTVQAQIMALLQDASRTSGTAIILITHDLGLLAHIAHRVLVMYAGKIVEAARTRELFDKPCHPYTKALLASMPLPCVGEKGKSKRLPAIRGMAPFLGNLPSGCAFHPRCPDVTPACMEKKPGIVNKTNTHWVRCVQ